MRNLALAALCCGLGGLFLAACGGGDDGPVNVGPDARDIDAAVVNPPECNPLGAAGAQGCNVGQKCTWITVQDTPESIGKIGCVPDGTVDPGGACTAGAVGETTGFDNCKAGNICVAGACKDICGFGGGAQEACANGQACTRYSDLFANGMDDPMYGACNPTCNPVTQLRGDGTMCPTGNGCYLLVSATTSTAVCASAGNIGHGVVIPGQAFANSCVPGAQPRAQDNAGTIVECGGLCAVKDVYVTNPADVTFSPPADKASPVPKTAAQAAQVTNFAAEAGMAPNDCTSKWGADAPNVANTGEGCRYWWAREGFDNLSPFSNTVGWCFKHDAFQFDSDGNTSDDHRFPRCAALSQGDNVLPIANPPGNDAIYFWCVALPDMLQTSIKHVKKDIQHHEVMIDRLGDWR